MGKAHAGGALPRPAPPPGRRTDGQRLGVLRLRRRGLPGPRFRAGLLPLPPGGGCGGPAQRLPAGTGLRRASPGIPGLPPPPAAAGGRRPPGRAADRGIHGGEDRFAGRAAHPGPVADGAGAVPGRGGERGNILRQPGRAQPHPGGTPLFPGGRAAEKAGGAAFAHGPVRAVQLPALSPARGDRGRPTGGGGIRRQRHVGPLPAAPALPALLQVGLPGPAGAAGGGRRGGGPGAHPQHGQRPRRGGGKGAPHGGRRRLGGGSPSGPGPQPGGGQRAGGSGLRFEPAGGGPAAAEHAHSGRRVRAGS